MPGITPVDFVAAQLRAAAPSASWDVEGIDRARELAGMLVREGIRDITSLCLQPITTYIDSPIVGSEGAVIATERVPVPGYRLFDRRTQTGVGFLGTPDRRDVSEALEHSDIGFKLAWSAAGHGNVSYMVRSTPGGFAIVPVWQSSSDLGELRSLLKEAGPLALAMVGFAGIPAGSWLGQMILGPELAASAPALSSAIGNVALQTAMTGGDVAASVRNVAVSYLGAQGGNAVAASTGVRVLGNVAQAATIAAIRGGDVRAAVSSSLLASGVQAMPSFIDVPIDEYPIDTYPPETTWDPGVIGDPVPWEPPTVPPIDIPVIEVTPPSVPPFYDPETMGPPPLPIPEVSITPTPGGGAGTWDQIAQAARAVLQLLPAVRAVNRPPVTVPNVRLPNGHVQQTLDNGMIVTRDASGRVISTTRAPVGIARMTSSGTMIVNNGNGTYDVVSSTGQRQTRPYSSGGIGELLSHPAVLIGGVAAMLLLASKWSKRG